MSSFTHQDSLSTIEIAPPSNEQQSEVQAKCRNAVGSGEDESPKAFLITVYTSPVVESRGEGIYWRRIPSVGWLVCRQVPNCGQEPCIHILEYRALFEVMWSRTLCNRLTGVPFLFWITDWRGRSEILSLDACHSINVKLLMLEQAGLHNWDEWPYLED